MSYFHKFHFSFEEKNYLSPNISKNHQKKITKKPETKICGIRRGIFDCLKRDRDIFLKNIIPSQNVAFGCTPSLRN